MIGGENELGSEFQRGYHVAFEGFSKYSEHIGGIKIRIELDPGMCPLD